MSPSRPRRRNAEVLAALGPWRGARVLDAGCGTGALLGWLLRQGARPVGLDPEPGNLVAARGRAPDVPLVAGRGEAMPFADAAFDVVVWFNALHHVPAPHMDDALVESLRVLAPEGRLLVVEPLAEGPWFEVMRPLEDETEERRAAADALRRLVERGDARLLATSEWTDPARVRDFAALRSRLLAADPARATVLPRVEAELGARFAALARPTADGFELDQPMRLDLLVPARASSHSRHGTVTYPSRPQGR